jgi:hypothetical protein
MIVDIKKRSSLSEGAYALVVSDVLEACTVFLTPAQKRSVDQPARAVAGAVWHSVHTSVGATFLFFLFCDSQIAPLATLMLC